jgi:hypothetical protein
MNRDIIARRMSAFALIAGLMVLIPAVSASAQPGSQMRVTGTGGDGLILRAEARSTAAIVTVEPEGATVTIVGPEQSLAGRTWLPARDGQGRTGWLAAEYLTLVQQPTTAGTGPAPAITIIDESTSSVPESTATPLPRSSARREGESKEAEPEKDAPLTLEIRFKSPEIDRRDRQTIYVDVTRDSAPVQDVTVRFTVDDEDPEVEREARVTNSNGRSTHEWSMRKYRGTTMVRVVATAPDGGTGKANRSFFVK